MSELPSDMDPAEFRREAHRLADWVADYLESSERYPVLSQVRPGQVRSALPQAPPDQGEEFHRIFEDFERILMPAMTHWNHPAFFAYFSISASAPGVLGEFLSAALNQQAMLWRTSPASTELEQVTMAWLRRMLALPAEFHGVIYDTASVSTLHALAAARERLGLPIRGQGMSGLPPLTVYCSEEAHNSVDKAVILLGLGHAHLRKIPTDANFRLQPELLRAALRRDRENGCRPMAVVATVGTTSTTSLDPVPEVAAICREEEVWLHVDAAYAGSAAVAEEYRWVLAGCEQADSIVLNPHKWLFIPFDLSVLYVRDLHWLKAAFALVADYLRTGQDEVYNLMDTGIQLGRRFRSLKLWFVLRSLGVERIAANIRRACSLAARFAGLVDASPRFERKAPVPLSVVCFRACPAEVPESELDPLNQRLLDAVNATGRVFLSHTRLRGQLVLRLAVGHLKTSERHVELAWQVLNEQLDGLRAQAAVEGSSRAE